VARNSTHQRERRQQQGDDPSGIERPGTAFVGPEQQHAAVRQQQRAADIAGADRLQMQLEVGPAQFGRVIDDLFAQARKLHRAGGAPSLRPPVERKTVGTQRLCRLLPLGDRGPPDCTAGNDEAFGNARGIVLAQGEAVGALEQERVRREIHHRDKQQDRQKPLGQAKAAGQHQPRCTSALNM
jgi:hypothetical protein